MEMTGGATLIILAMVLLFQCKGVLGTCPAIPYCKECSQNDDNEGTCTQCYPLYGLNTRRSDDAENHNERPCSSCREQEGCLLCRNNTMCDICLHPAIDGPDRNGLGTCSRCAANCAYCGKSGGGKCDICKRGYRWNGQTCAACMEKCDVCSDSNTCKHCSVGYYVREPSVCSECVENCELCVDKETCRICAPGFYRNNSGHCAPCGENCAYCDRESGYPCYRCTVGNGQLGLDGSCDCSANCKSCKKRGAGSCDECVEGYYFDEVQEQCVRLSQQSQRQ